jgi:hypothetical protein
MTEKQLRKIVEKWLQDKGCYVAHEIMVSGYIDLIGAKYKTRIGREIPGVEEIIGVELKISDILGVIGQAFNNCWFCDYSYAAMPKENISKMRQASLDKFKSRGVGLLAVDVESNQVEVIVEANKNSIEHSPNILRRLWNFKIRHSAMKK